jgi:hypothetical protein
VFIVGIRKGKAGEPTFCRVAVTRRTRGWIHASALAVQGRAGEEQRILTRIEDSSDGVERITLCQIIIERFGKSLVPRAMLALGEEGNELPKQVSEPRLVEVRSAEGTRDAIWAMPV